jgi:Uma2 family endonuclease
MSSNMPPALLTIDDLDDFPDDGNRYELIDGELVVSPPPALPHQLLQSRLLIRLDRAAPAGVEILAAPVGVERGNDTHVEPDLLVVPRSALGGDKLAERPLLVVEILSPSSRSYDSVRKRRVYEQMGVPSYWIADPIAASLTVLELVDGTYQDVASAHGAETVTVERPFPLAITPDELVRV